MNKEIAIQIETLKDLRALDGSGKSEFAKRNEIPIRTLEDWEAGRRAMPSYVLRLLEYKVRLEHKKEIKSRNLNVISDEDGKSIVLINHQWK